jgi:uncharacterized protein YyaL (SSP411 family)
MIEEKNSLSQNSLARAASAYLRSAQHQPVQWQQWGEEAFKLAEREGKPILLDIGAVWCHWCHVMDRESYEDAKTAQVINENFIAVKVDRDERPDVDSRYQAAVAAISGQGGWPLTAFLTPTGKPYFGGTYFPPEERYGRPSFQRVLLTMADAWKSRRNEVMESSASILEAIESNENLSGRSGPLGPALVDGLVKSALGQFDARHGGFGTQPKFPHSAALDLLMDVATRGGEQAELARKAALTTLHKMADGGIHDHLGGGFHRYSVDERWVVPHFEKMSYDNSALLQNYTHALQSFADVRCGKVARGIIRWMDAWLSDRERGGFYASQDADITLDDDGDYFTWTRDEAAVVLDREELGVAGPYYDIGEIGDMHHNAAKNVLHVRFPLEEIALRAELEPKEAEAIIARANAKLYAARCKRNTPFVDKTIYVGWNGMCISAYLQAARVMDMHEARDFALKSLDRLLSAGWDPVLGMSHVIAYGEASRATVRIPGVLDDYVFAALACLDAWECTGRMHYYNTAQQITESLMARFQDKTGGGFFDTQIPLVHEKPLGALSARRKPLQDTPTPAGNAMAATLLMRLECLSGREAFANLAEDTLEAFAGVVQHFGLYVGSFGLALQTVIHPRLQVVVVGEDEHARRLEAVALFRYAANKSVVRLSHRKILQGDLPEALAETLPNLPELRDGRTYALVCSGTSCMAPINDEETLLATLATAI